MNQLESALQVGHTQQVMFAGDDVLLAGQIDYPVSPPPAQGYPLMFLLHHAGCNTREDYGHYAEIGLRTNYAVFRWDKRGTGRSGSGGRGSIVQDAVNAYKTALTQLGINQQQVVILAQAEGTVLLGEGFALFSRVQQPAGAVLVSNMLDENAILTVQTRVKIIATNKDWHPWQRYAKAACDAHNRTFHYGASFYVALDADRNLMNNRTGEWMFNGIARDELTDWLKSLA